MSTQNYANTRAYPYNYTDRLKNTEANVLLRYTFGNATNYGCDFGVRSTFGNNLIGPLAPVALASNKGVQVAEWLARRPLTNAARVRFPAGDLIPAS